MVMLLLVYLVAWREERSRRCMGRRGWGRRFLGRRWFCGGHLMMVDYVSPGSLLTLVAGCSWLLVF